MWVYLGNHSFYQKESIKHALPEEWIILMQVSNIYYLTATCFHPYAGTIEVLYIPKIKEEILKVEKNNSSWTVILP